MKTNTKTDRPKKADKDRIATVIAAILIVLFLGGSVFIGLTGSGIAGDKNPRSQSLSKDSSGDPCSVGPFYFPFVGAVFFSSVRQNSINCRTFLSSLSFFCQCPVLHFSKSLYLK